MSAETAFPDSRPHSVFTWLFNPFHFIAGGQALAVGIGIIAVSTLVALVAGVHFDRDRRIRKASLEGSC